MVGVTKQRDEFLRTLRRLWPVLITIVLCCGCNDHRAVSQLPNTHPDSWTITTSENFHGKVARRNGIASCTKCHGDDLTGGRVDISCLDCHLSSGACVACHGGLNDQTGAPPYGLRGETENTTLAVGAHTTHLSGTPRSAAVSCESCHLVPTNMLEPYHFDIGDEPLDSIAEITWQDFADGGGANWNRNSRSCSGTYCHGNFDGGYPDNEPVWTDSEQASCGSCHDSGDNPADLGLLHAIHCISGGLVCADCHPEVVDSSLTILTPSLHINGMIEILAPNQPVCDECHGTGSDACIHCHGGVDNLTGAPPRGLRGETSASTLAVGAHTTHMETGYVADAFSCSECHLVPTQLTDPGHWETDSTAEITWGVLAGSAALWDRNTRECTNTYCHGNFNGGYMANSPMWTAPGQAACGSCHDDGSNPRDLSGEHDKHVREENVGCYQCHASTVDVGLAIIGKGVHVDGKVTMNFGSRQITYQNGSCSGPDACHEPEDW